MRPWTFLCVLCVGCGAEGPTSESDAGGAASAASDGADATGGPGGPTSGQGSDGDDSADTGGPPPSDAKYVEEAEAALAEAIGFYHGTLARHGGYVWTYSVDLSRKWGEGEATDDQIWVQPPGTPAIGMVFLRAHQLTGRASYLSVAQEAADALLYGQLVTGGWTNSIDFDPGGDRTADYRNGMGSGTSNSSLDDDITQSTLRFLALIDGETGKSDPVLAEAIVFGFDALLAAQFPAGAFPGVWDEGGVMNLPVLPASIPDPYPTVPNGGDYWDFPTLNDNLAGAVTRALLAAWDTYRAPRYRDAIVDLGEFLLLAQLPDPQPGWAQQYNAQMEPGWARKFEPPAVTGWESQDVMETLLVAYELTGDPRFADAVGRGLAYFEGNLLTDGQLARFYELTTDTPLYFTSDYVLTYDDSDLPGHYGFKMPSRLPKIEAERARLVAGRPKPRVDAADLEDRVLEVIDALDGDGRWVDRDIKVASGIPQGDYILSRTFVDNAGVLLDYLEAAQ